MDQKVKTELWDTEKVGAALVQAFVTLDLLPMQTMRGPKSNWPQTILEWGDKVACEGMDPIEKKIRQDAANSLKLYPSSISITQMEMAFDWLRELRLEDSGLAIVVTFWALRTARGRSIRSLCVEKNWARHTFFRKRAKALQELVILLNSRGIAVF